MADKLLLEGIEIIMIMDGPDRHCDGAELIHDFVLAWSEGNAEDWLNDHYTQWNDYSKTKKRMVRNGR